MKSKKSLVLLIVMMLVVSMLLVACDTDEEGITWGEWEVVKTPTQQEEGEIKRTASDGKVETASLPVINETNYTKTITIEPSCEVDGRVEYKATIMGKEYIYTFALDKLGHIWGEPNYTWKDNHTSCLAKRVCTRDSAHIERANDTITSEVVAPTFDAYGYTIYTATFNKEWAKTQTEIIVGDGKYVLNKVNRKEPTVNAVGNIEYYKGTDGKYYNDIKRTKEITLKSTIIPKLEVTKVDKKEPIYGVDGQKEYYYETNNKANKYYLVDGIYVAIPSEADLVIPEQKGTITIYVNGVKQDTVITHKKSDVYDSKAVLDIVEATGKDYVSLDLYNSDLDTKEQILDPSEHVKKNQDAKFYFYKRYKVQFNSNGGQCEEVESIIQFGSKYGVLPVPTLDGFTLDGWYNEENKLVTADTVIDAKPHTLKANLVQKDLKFAVTKDNLAYSVTGYVGSVTDIVIPTLYDGKPVVAIGTDAFKNKSDIISVTIPDSITSIMDNAFSGCIALTSLLIPSSVDTIKAGAFEGCSALTIYALGSAKPTGWLDGYNPNARPVYFYIETEPTVAIWATGFKYWHYVDTTPTVWVEPTYNITYEGAEGVSNDTYKPSEEVILPTPSAKAGFVFDGWYNKANNEYMMIIPKGSKGDITFYANFVQEGLTFILTSDETGCTVSSLGITANSVTIPNIYHDKKVVGIGDNGFNGNTNIVSVTFEPNSNITYIGSSAFSECTNLTSVTMPSSLKTIKPCAFYGCDMLQTINIPSGIESIENEAFMGAVMDTIVLPAGVQLGTDLFTGCVNLNIYVDAFTKPEIWAEGWNCNRPVYYYNESEPTIEQWATGTKYWHYTDVEKTQIEIWTDIYTVQLNLEGTAYTLTGYNGVSSDLTLPTTYFGKPITTIGEYAFSKKSNLASIVIPSSYAVIENNAFEYCDSLTSVTLNEGLTTIGKDAFYTCKLNSIEIPSTVDTIGNNSLFTQNSHVYDSIKVNPANKTYTSRDAEDNECNVIMKKASKTIIFMDECSTIPSDAKVIEKDAGNIDNLTELTIPANIVEIKPYALKGKKYSDTYIYIDNPYCFCDKNSFNIGYAYIYQCTDMGLVGSSNVDINGYYKYDEDGKTRIPTNAYEIISEEDKTVKIICNIETGDLIIPSTYQGYKVIGIGAQAFNRGTITSVSIADTVKVIEHDAFIDCTKLTSVIFGENSNLEEISSNAFSNCNKLTEFIVPSKVKKIGIKTFLGCTELKTIKVDARNKLFTSRDNENNECNVIVYIGDTPYTDEQKYEYTKNDLICGINNATIPSFVDKICNNAFRKTTQGDFVIPNSVAYIDDNAFNEMNCNSISFEADDATAANELYIGTNALKFVIVKEAINDIISIVIPTRFSGAGGYIFYSQDYQIDIYLRGTKLPEGLPANWNTNGNIFKLYIYSEATPTEDQLAVHNRYWRYVDGVPTEWV